MYRTWVSRFFCRLAGLPRVPTAWVGCRAGGYLLLVTLLAIGAAPPAKASEIRVVVAGPRTGPHADRTRAVWAGAESAADAINRRGGVRGSAIKLVLKDDACAAEAAAQVADEIAAEGTDLVIGHPCSGAADSAAKVYGAKGVLFIATSSRHGGLTASRAGPSIFRIAGRDDGQAAVAAAFLIDHFHGRAIALAHDRTRYARTLAEEVARRLSKADQTAPTVATLVAGEMDFPRVTAKIKEADAIFYAGFPVEAGLLYAELRKAGSAAVVVFSDSVGSTEFAATFGMKVRDALVLRPRFAVGGDGIASDDDESARLTDGDRINAQAALEAYASAATQADALTPDKVRIILDGYPLETRLGMIRFGKTGDAERRSYDVVRWNGQSWEALTEGATAGKINAGPLD